MSPHALTPSASTLVPRTKEILRRSSRDARARQRNRRFEQPAHLAGRRYLIVACTVITDVPEAAGP